MVLRSPGGCLLVLVPELTDVVNAHLNGPPVEYAVAALRAFPHAGGAHLRGQDRGIRAGAVQDLAGEAAEVLVGDQPGVIAVGRVPGGPDVQFIGRG
jgi:hypothetical protein